MQWLEMQDKKMMIHTESVLYNLGHEQAVHHREQTIEKFTEKGTMVSVCFILAIACMVDLIIGDVLHYYIISSSAIPC